MSFLRKNPLFVAFFVLILGPTIILSVFSFRNILNENFLAEKTFEEHQQSFRKDVENAVRSEQNKIFSEVKAASLFLYEQPNNLLSFGSNVQHKDVAGVKSTFLFNGDTLIYPHFPVFFNLKRESFSSTAATPIEQGIFIEETRDFEKAQLARSIRLLQAPFEPRTEQVSNMLGMLRYAYQGKNYDEALRIINALEQNRVKQGYLQSNITASLRQLHFEILVLKNQRREAEKFCQANLKSFFAGENFGDIASVKFLFESMLDQVLSFEDLSEESREEFWNLRTNFSREIETSEYFTKHKEEIFKLHKEASEKDGLFIEQNDNETFFRMSHPWLAGKQVVIGILENNIVETRIMNRILEVAKDWKDVPYILRNSKDSILIKNAQITEYLYTQKEIGSNLHMELSIFQRDESEIAAETTHKIILMSALIVFSLITVIAGMFFMFRSVHQERSLLSMKANFLSSISHELKTPLTSIKMFAEMMAKGRIRNMERIPEYANMICKETTRLENLIGAILNYTRMENGRSAFQWERLNLATAAEKVFENIEQIAINRGLTIDKHLDPDNFITGDYTAVYSMIQNLIENAIKYTTPPGEIHVRVYSENEYAIFEVQDTGIGIAQSEQKNIFNDFYRVGDEMTRSTKGSGLGLAIVKRAADAHKATITLASKPGSGSTFSVKFRKAE